VEKSSVDGGEGYDVRRRHSTPKRNLPGIVRHGGRVEDVVTLELDLPRSWLKRNRRGVWYVARDVPFDRVRRIGTFAEVAGAVA
jgi:hypothetical protein